MKSQSMLRVGEVYSGMVLEHLFPDCFESLECLDKPDLQSKQMNLGIEVTSCVSSDEMKASACLADLRCSDENKRRRIQSHVETALPAPNTVFYNNLPNGGRIPSIESGGGSAAWSRLVQCHAKKLSTLNQGGYTKFDRYFLFIYSGLDTEFDDSSVVLEQLMNQSKQFNMHYEQVFVCAPTLLFLFDIDKQSVEKIPFDQKENESLMLKARRYCQMKS